MANAAYRMGRAHVPDPADRPRFDAWYRDHHLNFARRRFGASTASRFWSVSEPAYHIALYRFPSLAVAEERVGPDRLAPLLADFDAAWPHIARVREIVEQVQQLEG
jgi:hypothetical protein